MTDARRKAVIAFGFVTVAFWFSSAVFPQPIPPLVPLPNLEGLLAEIAPWIREQVPSLRRPDHMIIASVRREMVAALTLKWLVIVTGAASGLLVALRQRVGRWVAIALCAGLLGLFAVGQSRLIWEHHFVVFWTAMAQRLPRNFIRTVVDVLFYAVTVVYLTRHPVVAWFKQGRPGNESPFAGPGISE